MSASKSSKTRKSGKRQPQRSKQERSTTQRKQARKQASKPANATKPNDAVQRAQQARRDRVRPRILVLGGGADENIRLAGGEPVHVGNHDPRACEAAEHENIHGLLLLGGGDVNPQLYGMQRDRTVYGVDDTRDEVEWDALSAARDRGIPVMGICRGSQMMNVHAGGTLFLDIRRDANAHGYHRGCDHHTDAVEGSRLRKAWRRADSWVISIHHQAVQKVGEGLQVAAYARDGIIEAIESSDPDRWELGVQFHPEMADNVRHQQRIFDAFVYAAGKKAGIKVIPETWSRPITIPAAKPQAPAQNAPRKPLRAAKPLSFEQWQVAKRDQLARGRTYQGTWGGPVNVAWRCFRGCGVQFDLELDYVDHMSMLHGQVVEMASTDRSE